jgi:hypothetical protein
MKQIPLTRGLFALVDDEDFDRVSQFKWTAETSPKDNTFYACRSVKVGGKWTHESLHHKILDHLPRRQRIDHRDGDGLNNQKSNLRPASHSENLRNMRCRNKHGLKGICLLSYGAKPWKAKITYDGKLRHIGYYATAIEAAEAYDKKASEVFGEFARLNFA